MLALSKRIVSSDLRAEQGLPVGPPNTVRNESWNAIVVRNRRVDRYLLLPITCCCSNVFEIIADLLSLLHLEIVATIFRPVKIVGYFYSSIGLMVSRHKAVSVCVPKGTPTWVSVDNALALLSDSYVQDQTGAHRGWGSLVQFHSLV